MTEDAGLARALALAAFVALPAALVDHYFDAQGLVGAVRRAVMARGTGLGNLRGFNLVVAGSAFDPKIVEVLGVGKIELGGVVLVVTGLALDLEHVEVRLVWEDDLADRGLKEEDLLGLQVIVGCRRSHHEARGEDDHRYQDLVLDSDMFHDTSIDAVGRAISAIFINCGISQSVAKKGDRCSVIDCDSCGIDHVGDFTPPPHSVQENGTDEDAGLHQAGVGCLIEDGMSLLARLHHVVVLEDLEVLADRRQGSLAGVRELADAHLSVREDRHDHESRRVRQDLAEVGVEREELRVAYFHHCESIFFRNLCQPRLPKNSAARAVFFNDR